MSAPRKNISHNKIIIIYWVVLALVCFHQAGRLASWFEDQGREKSGRWADACLNVAGFLLQKVDPVGPASLNRVEDSFLAFLKPAMMVGEVKAPVATAAAGNPAADVETAGPAVKDVAAETSLPGEAAPDETAEELKEPAVENGEGQSSPSAITKSLGDQPLEDPDKTAEIFKPQSVLLLGDSMMLEGIGPSLQRRFKEYEGLVINRTGRYGTGLTRLDVFDWLAYFDEMVDKYSPDLVIITLGANDPQDIVDENKKRHYVEDETWAEIYGGRVKDLLERAEKKNVTVFWLGLPIMGREKYNVKVEILNKVIADQCAQAANCRFWDGWLSVADADGKYVTHITGEDGKHVRIRAKDSIHLTEKGGEIMAQKFMDETKEWADYVQPAPPAAAGEDDAAESPEGEGVTPDDQKTEGEEGVKAEDKADSQKTGGDSKNDESKIINSGKEAMMAEEALTSASLGGQTKYRAIVPPGKGSFPAVFLLHGAWGDYKAWSDGAGAALLAAAAKEGLIIIMPDGGQFGWYLDSPVKPASQYESYLMKELLPEVLKKFPVDSEKLAISGLSMGGHGALNMAIKYPQTFKVATSLSGVTDLTAHSDNRQINTQIKISDVLGPYKKNKQQWLDSSAYHRLKASPKALEGTAILLGVGQDDPLTLEENRAFAALLKQLGVNYEYQETSGGHDWGYWGGQIAGHLHFIGERLKKAK